MNFGNALIGRGQKSANTPPQEFYSGVVNQPPEVIVVPLANYELQVVGMPKGGRIRYVPLTKRLVVALNVGRHLRGPRVLCGSEGKPLTQKMISGRDAAGRQSGKRQGRRSHPAAHVPFPSGHERGATGRVSRRRREPTWSQRHGDSVSFLKPASDSLSRTSCRTNIARRAGSPLWWHVN
jgi:hypothetical protein